MVADAVLSEGEAFHALLDSMQLVVSDTDLLNMTDEELGRMLRETRDLRARATARRRGSGDV